MTARFDAIVIGGGFYGLRIALFLREQLGCREVAVVEREHNLMSRASYTNQARVHNGYHYPRSILTAYRSRVNFARFRQEYGEAVVDNFEHYYAIARRLSKTNASQFETFCRRIGAPVSEPPQAVAALFATPLIERVFGVQEPAFNSLILRDLMISRIDSVGGVSFFMDTDVAMLEGRPGSPIEVHAKGLTLRSTRVISAIYSQINELHRSSNLPLVPLQHEIAEMALVRLPCELQGRAFTVMDGPFFSIMPFPPRGLHTLSHVRYTPHYRWQDDKDRRGPNPATVVTQIDKTSHFYSMLSDVVRYIPSAAAVSQVDSVYEAKTVLTASDVDDSRPILFRSNLGIEGYSCVMGGKLDNIYDVLQELENLYGNE